MGAEGGVAFAAGMGVGQVEGAVWLALHLVVIAVGALAEMELGDDVGEGWDVVETGIALDKGEVGAAIEHDEVAWLNEGAGFLARGQEDEVQGAGGRDAGGHMGEGAILEEPGVQGDKGVIEFRKGLTDGLTGEVAALGDGLGEATGGDTLPYPLLGGELGAEAAVEKDQAVAVESEGQRIETFGGVSGDGGRGGKMPSALFHGGDVGEAPGFLPGGGEAQLAEAVDGVLTDVVEPDWHAIAPAELFVAVEEIGLFLGGGGHTAASMDFSASSISQS